MTTTIGIDVGSGAIKSVLFRHEDGKPQWLARRCERIRRRDPMTLAREGFEGVLADAGLDEDDIDYTVAWILLTYLGVLGIHRFYQGKWISGVVYLLTGGLLGIGVIYDFWTLNDQVSEANAA